MKSLRPQELTMVDAWLRGEFKSCYDAALHEPIPEELVALLQGASDAR